MTLFKSQNAGDSSFHQLLAFDWDDTLCCSSYLHKLGYDLESKRPFPEPLHSQLLAIDEASCQLLKAAVALVGHRDVYIVTNAEEKWVDMSAKLFLPRTSAFLLKVDCKIISARCLYENMWPRKPTKWKYLAFEALMCPSNKAFAEQSSSSMWGPLRVANQNIPREHNSHASKSAMRLMETNSINCTAAGIRKCICSVGDSQAERQAAHFIAEKLPDTLFKTIKFIDRPSAEELYFQLETMITNLESIVRYGGQIDHMLVLAQKFR